MAGTRLVPAPSITKGSLFKAATATLRAQVRNSTPEDAARSLYGKDHALDFLLSRSTSSPASVANSGWAGVLAHQVVGDLLQAIVSISAGAALLGRSQQIDFDRRQSIRLPQRLVDPAYAGVWTQEGTPIPVFQFPVSSGVTLTPHKLTVITTFTREMAESSNIEVFVRQLLSESAALALDKCLFGAQADDGVTPPGLLHGVAALTASTATVRSDAMAQDLGNLVQALANAGGGANPVFICAAAQAIAMRIFAGPRFDDSILASTVLPAGTVICIEPRSLVATVDAAVPEFDIKTAPLLQMSSPAVDVIAGAPTRSMFQIDSLAMRMALRDIDWKLRAPHLSWVQATNW
jgi:hypothetical protein